MAFSSDYAFRAGVAAIRAGVDLHRDDLLAGSVQVLGDLFYDRAEVADGSDRIGSSRSERGLLGSPAMAGAGYVALLRGINVGGKNIVRMADLRAAFEEAGYAAVGTYIQSGNLLFESAIPPTSLESDIERVLADRFRLSVVVVVRSHRQYRDVVDRAPYGFGTAPDIYHSDVIFLKAPLSSREAMRVVDPRDGVDQIWPGEGVLYFSRLSKRLSQSRMSRIASSPLYQNMTIRNWRTTTKLLSLLDQRVEKA